METTQKASLPEAQNQHIYRLLVVDDNETCAKVMMWTLEALGHEARMATDGPTAIALARKFQPDAVLLDIGMPEMNGYEVCQAMRKEPVLQHTLFIAQTGWSQQEHRERTKAAGFHHHLVKPLDVEVLKNVIVLLDEARASEI